MRRHTVAPSGDSILRREGYPSDALSGLTLSFIGGGFAGLSGAVEAKRLGAKTLVFDPRGRGGGRAWTLLDMVPDGFVDGGGEFIGSNHFEWMQYLDIFKLELQPISADDYSGPVSPLCVDAAERVLSRTAASELHAEMNAIVAPMNEVAAEINPTKPWKTPGGRELDTRTVGGLINELRISEIARDALRVQFEANQGIRPERVSLLGFAALVRGHAKTERGQEDLNAFWSEAEAFRCRGGVGRLTAEFEQVLGEDIRYRNRVTRIDATGPRVEVENEDGRVFRCDYAALAVPVSLWPSIDIRPRIPRSLAPSYGNNVKLMVKLPKSFPTTWGLSSLAVRGKGALQLIWESTAGQDVPHKVLTCFSGGKAALALCKMREKERNRACLEELDELMPGLARAALEVRFIGWPSRRNTGCGYSYPAPGDVTGKWKAWWKGYDRLGFIGEAFSDHWSFMNGALRSGVRWVRQLAERTNERRCA